MNLLDKFNEICDVVHVSRIRCFGHNFFEKILVCKFVYAVLDVFLVFEVVS